jgi:hypothetical protein
MGDQSVDPRAPIVEEDVPAVVGLGLPRHQVSGQRGENDVLPVGADSEVGEGVVHHVEIAVGVDGHVGLAGRVGDQRRGAGDAVAEKDVDREGLVDLSRRQIRGVAAEDCISAVGGHHRGEGGVAVHIRNGIGLRDQHDRVGRGVAGGKGQD